MTLSGSVAVVEGMLKSSRVSTATRFRAKTGARHSGCGMRPMNPVPDLAQSQRPRLDGVCRSPSSSSIVPSLGLLSKLRRGSSGTRRDHISVEPPIFRCSSVGIFRHFSLSLTASRLGGRLATAVSGKVPTVEIAGLVRRRRSGPALARS